MYIAEKQLVLSPSDVNNHFECAHLSALNLAYANGDRTHEPSSSPEAELLSTKGDEHEASYLVSLKAEGRGVAEIADPADRSLAALASSAAQTERAMRAGPEVIFQATFFQAPFRGHADFLFRVDRPSDLGSWSYEVADTKLARRAKPYFILQLCHYSELLARVQGAEPELIHVILGDRRTESYRLAEFSAYFRRVRSRFAAALDDGADGTYPEPVGHCAVCRWSERCDAQRESDDHLSLVAGIRASHVDALRAAGISTLEQLASWDPTAEVKGIRAEMLARICDQAALQQQAKGPAEPPLRLLEPEPGLGFERMPQPSEGDVFFDMEGDPFFEGGLEYLFGLVLNDQAEPEFKALWGRDRSEEKQALEAFIDLITVRRARWPDLHVYHYAHYEVSALKRLCGAHGTREDELDDLLRGRVFVDLYRVVKEAMRIGQPSYGLKKVEGYYMEQRATQVTDGNASVVEFERWLDQGDDQILAEIADYNRDDCLSTLWLRDWLLGQREVAESEHGAALAWFAGPEQQEPDESEDPTADEETAPLRAALVAEVPADVERRSPEHAAMALCAQLLDYHHREARPVWWTYFANLERDPAELIDDADCIGGLSPAPGAKPERVGQSLVLRMRFDPQETKMGTGNVHDPRAPKPSVEIKEINAQEGWLDLRRGPKQAENPWPTALIPGGPYGTGEQRGALRRLATAVIEHGPSAESGGAYRACRDLLMGATPRLSGHQPGAPLHGEDVELERLKEVTRAMDQSALMIQGPPGSGKTYTAGRLIVDLIERGKRVGVTSTSHRAIHNLLDEVEAVASEPGTDFAGLKKHTGGNPESEYESERIKSTPHNEPLTDPEVALAAATAWHFCRAEVDHTLDYLFIDEAGQISLADALALGTAADNVVLMGDPQQLPQVTQAAHPGQSGLSVLEHLLGARQTIPPSEGIFLGESYRMHPDVCGFISELMYEGRLHSAPGREAQTIELAGTTELGGSGISWLAVEHAGNSQSSPEEAAAIAAALAGFEGATYTDVEGEQYSLGSADVMVITPFNAQVRCLEAHLPADVRVGTVDKFQGQEAQLVFFSLAASSGEEVPRGLEFLLSRNRLNVAISRARAKAVAVSSPGLLDIHCRTIDQMRLANAICRIAELET